MFVKNAWYCAGWDYMVSQGKNSIVARKLADIRVVLYRKPNGEVVALEDRCPHRMAALSLGKKEGDSIRCMYHGMRFSPDGICVEIPGQDRIPPKACVKSFPVIERNNWIWVWLGDPKKADPKLIPYAVGPSDSNWNMKTSHMHVDANYRFEIANLADLSHLTWVHEKTLGGTDKYTRSKVEHTLTDQSLITHFIARDVPAPYFLQHLFPVDARFDLEFNVTHSIPCTWILNFKAFTAGTASSGPSNGELVANTMTCQAVVPNDDKSVEYYFSWGSHIDYDFPGLSDLLREILDEAFLEDAAMLESQQVNYEANPEFKMMDICHDAGPNKILWLLDKLIKDEAAEPVN
ncbi:aromatic ring-hydroxylating dioxygenase subunit alpha [Zhongshania marina]|uniref:Vanillate O-demethylase oxygenase n=1 Tax=Zhongshania marina TaxID=2304603 RepID=A0A2S4HKH0_9GAMM|nr:aromatic ring-hydroxylating dioxygenase subunit alpha [Marortus luteolus]POP54492.1 vanillate O-demethylase oxygenase [Marortus luteolus]